MQNTPTEGRLAVQVKGLVKSFGGPPVLQGLDLEVAWGQRFVLFGGNGSGKTTLIKLLSTLARPDQGVVRVAGWDARRQGQMLRGSVGVVTHQPMLYGDLSGHENLRFFGKMFRVDNLEERIQTLARQVGMENHLSKRVRTLSHGMQKRLSLARALLHDPPVLLLDEPEAGLDEEALDMLDALLTSSGSPTRTVVMTTHNLERGLAIGDRLGILAGGRIAFQESRDALDVAGFRKTVLRYLEEAR